MIQGTITRKELSTKINLSVRTIKRHERAWRLCDCRVSVPEIPHTYFLSKVNETLLRLRVIEKPIS